jgi:hypothetical protein
MQADTEPSSLTACYRARRPHGMIQVFDSGGNVFEKMLSRFGQSDAAVTPLEQKNAKLLFELLDPRANGGLTHSQGSGRMTKV